MHARYLPMVVSAAATSASAAAHAGPREAALRCAARTDVAALAAMAPEAADGRPVRQARDAVAQASAVRRRALLAPLRAHASQRGAHRSGGGRRGFHGGLGLCGA